MQVIKVPIYWRHQIGLPVASLEKEKFTHNAFYFHKLMSKLPGGNKHNDFENKESHK
jgi:hypothetical protein